MTGNIEKLKNLLSIEKKIVITTHINPDGDAIGSSLALFHFLKKLGYKVNIITPNQHPSFLDWVPGCNEIIVFDKNKEYSSNLISESDLLFTLDFNDLSRCGEIGDYIKTKIHDIIMIDHHQSPSNYSKIMFSYPDASSTCELVYNLIKGLKNDSIIDKEIATCIYLGMMTDTGCFQYNSVNSETHKIVSSLLNKGIDHNSIYNKIYNSNNISKLRILGCALNSLTIVKDYKATYMYLSKKQLRENGYKKGDSEGLVNYGLSLKEINFTAIFIEDEDSEDLIKISFRSKNDFPCNLFASEFFDGGGHKNAAGGKFSGKLDEATSKFKDSIKKFNSKNKL